ncbi:NAD(P)H-hydrate dehydratase [Oceanithermus sp.]|uniref:NAD(P)H-hydrate dehydratase n=1 Tax=Oceanithermus sp. TaxID=2268145 RepID=UPI0025F09768|nr:NAD(P)H-hydrate dehydratase [Oceanithermus sp.]
MRLFTPEAMRAADARAVELGYPSLLLMEAAGRAVAEAALAAWPAAQRYVVVAGKGNNGGDGLVAARWLRLWGREVRVYAPEGHRGDAALARAALEAHRAIEPIEALDLRGAEVVVDALFGTGLTRPLEGEWAERVARINGAGARVLAVDVPSGLPHEPHVRADLTVALAGLKPAHAFYPERSACGRVVLADIGMPRALLEPRELPELLEPGAMRALLPSRPGDAHKGSVGRVLVVGGAPAYTGAPALAALGAYRAGAGLVTVAYPSGALVEPPLEAVRLPAPRWQDARLAEARAEAVAVGMGGGEGGGAAARAALRLRKPTLLDADALYPEVLRAYAEAALPTVITPHPGEAARLLDQSPAAVAADPLAHARELARRYRTVAVLKGGPTVICEPGRCAVNTTGNPAMATGGMGDVLSGVIAALLAAGLEPWDAARLGVYLHGLAGDEVARVGLVARDVAEALPTVRARLERGEVRPYWDWDLLGG